MLLCYLLSVYLLLVYSAAFRIDQTVRPTNLGAQHSEKV